MAEVQEVPVVAEKIQNTYPHLQRAHGVREEIVEPVAAVPVVAPAEQPKPADPTAPVVAAAPDPTPAKVDFDSMSEEDKNEMLAKLTGGKVKSIKDLEKPVVKTQAELDAEAETKRSAALEWGIFNKKLNRSQYDEAIIGAAKPDRDIALAAFVSEALAEDKDLSVEDATEMFMELHHEGAEEGSRLHKQGQKAIKKIADAYRAEKFGILDNIQSEYNDFEETQALYKEYTTTVKKVAAELPKTLPFEIPYKNIDGTDGEPIKLDIDIDDKIIAKLVKDYASENQFLMGGYDADNKVDAKKLLPQLQYHMKALAFDSVVASLLEKNSKEVEDRTMVQLGNKKGPAAVLNNGKQAGAAPKVQQRNEYSNLNSAYAAGR